MACGVLARRRVELRGRSAAAGSGPAGALATRRTAVRRQPAASRLRAQLRTLVGAVLRGRESPLETLFPGGSFELAQELYEQSATMRYINGLAAAAFEALSSATPRGPHSCACSKSAPAPAARRPSLLPVLPPDRTRYLFTDVSDAFLDAARARFGGLRASSSSALFDLDKDFAAAGLRAGKLRRHRLGQCVHAVKDLRAALARLRALLAPAACWSWWSPRRTLRTST